MRPKGNEPEATEGRIILVMNENYKKGGAEREPITREAFLMESNLHKAELIVMANHEATKMTLKRLGNMSDDLARIFSEQCRHCVHRYMPEGPAGWSCDQRNPGKHDGVYACQYGNCPYVNGEAL